MAQVPDGLSKPGNGEPPHILQVIGKFSYSPINYKIKDRIYRGKKLAAETLREHFGDCRVILLAPESLATMLTEDVEEAMKLLYKPDVLKKRVAEEVLENRLVEEPFNVVLIQAVGLYLCTKTSESVGRRVLYKVLFENHVDNIVSYILPELLGFQGELIVDVSTGHNIQVSSVIEAVRALLVYRKLKVILQGEETPSIRLSFTPPVLPPIPGDSGEATYPITLYDYDVKAFLEFPIKGETPGSATRLLAKSQPYIKDPVRPKREIGLTFKDMWKDVVRTLNEARAAFNAVKHTLLYPFFTGRSSKWRKIRLNASTR